MSDAPSRGGIAASGGPVVLSGVARGRALFNRADFWGSHEAIESAWRAAPSAERSWLQGLIQAGAAFHKYVVQDNPRGAGRLIARALDRLDGAPQDYMGLDLRPFRAELRSWQGRLADPEPVHGTIQGLPHLEWGAAGRAERLDIESIEVHELDVGAPGATLVAVRSGGDVGWGECRPDWSARGTWRSLTDALAPALLAEPVAAPAELPVRWAEVAANATARAGLEAAMWDLWARRRGESLVAALGLAPRPVPLSGRASGSTPEGLSAAIAHLVGCGYRHVLVPARPNADRRLIPEVIGTSPVPVAVDCGAAYRRSDLVVFEALAEAGAALLAEPYPVGALHETSRLSRHLSVPVSVGRWSTAEQAENAVALGALDVLHVDPGRCGLTEALRIAELAETHGVPLWIDSRARTSVGGASDLAVAMHPAATRPSVFDRPADADPAPGPDITPEADGAALPRSGPGLDLRPDPDWLAGATLRRAVLRA